MTPDTARAKMIKNMLHQERMDEDEWNEEDHPRAKNGQFAKKGQGEVRNAPVNNGNINKKNRNTVNQSGNSNTGSKSGKSKSSSSTKSNSANYMIRVPKVRLKKSEMKLGLNKVYPFSKVK